MDDPASRIPQQLIPHMHLVSRNRYPNMHMMPTETAVEYLLSAPRVCQTQPMHWTFLDGPQDGTVMMTWQPLAHLGNNFASDGYVWADAEQAFSFEARGYTVEMFLHRSGYHPPNENMASHCRKRYRIVSSKIPNAPQPDPSLWIVHYSRAPQQDHIPAARIPVTPQVQNMMNQRRYLQSQGQLARKEFLLHDRNNWPTISFPPQMPSQGFVQPQPAGYANAQPGRPGFYPPQAHPGAVPPAPAQAKTQRAHRAPSAAVAAATADFALEDEDVSSGDVMDLLTPREVSKMRYVQHHEWMEEIFASHYAISQIVPVSLGLGRKGELESLTAGFFDAPVGAESQDNQAPNATKLEPAKAEEFADRVAKKVADMTAEIEKLKKQHARRMERFNRSSLFKDAELRLRDAAADPTATGTEVWRLEGRIIVPNEEGETPQLDFLEEKAKYKVSDVVRDVETAWKKQIVPEPKVSCVEKGGLLEKIEPEQKEEPESFTNDMVIDQADSHLLNQFGGAGGNSTVPAQPGANISGDVDMDMGNQLGGGGTAGETGDWVMVNNENKDGNVASGAGEGNLESANFDDFTNIDSAGDALAAYTEQNDGLDLPDLDNSAFGDAFHASDNEHSHNPDADDMS
ncbi:SWI/SNF and RSC complexes subunit ssr4 [Penicillium rolfsii]|nr:SWI/SNF and RSC complexes subunit ssr4 [Penicillium rolfsii]